MSGDGSGLAAPADPAFALVARATRGGRDESWHFGAAAAVTPDGRPLARVGDPEVATFPRSALKPVQAVPLLEAGGEAAYDLDEADLALVTASHGGTPAHTERVAALLARIDRDASALGCGAHDPFDAAASRALLAAGEAPTPLHNNCSGKHAGMLLACRLRGWPEEGYLEPDHPLQRRILELVARLAGVEPGAVGVAVDGCSAPSYRLSLSAMARIYASLAHPEGAALEPELRAPFERLAGAIAAAPGMLAGPGHFTTRLIEATGGRLLGKDGAQGYFAVAVRGPVAMGLAVKIADGDLACRAGVVLEILRQLGVLSAAELEELAEFHRPAVRSHRGDEVGRIEPDVELVTAADRSPRP